MSEDQTQPLSPTDIEELCRKASAGDSTAVEALLWHYHGPLFGFSKRKIGTDWHGKIEPDDLLQEAYVDVFQDIAGFKWVDEDSFYRWTTRIIEHRFIDRVRALRRKKRDVAREQQAATGSRHSLLLQRCVGDSRTPSRILRQEDAVKAMMACIAQLPEDHRIVIQRLHLNEEPLAVVAADMGRSEDAVRRLASRALERLGECVGRASHYLSRIS